METNRQYHPGIMNVSRREVVLGAGAAITVAAGSQFLVPKVQAAPHDRLVSEFRKVLTPAQRNAIFLPWDDPSRQIVNTIAIRRAPHIGTLLDASQMPHAWQLWAAMQSESGRARFREPLKAEAGGLDGCVLTIYGDPDRGPCQSVISGGHLDLRAGAQTNGGFGDGVAYGHQVGNHELKVPGNVWAHHSDALNHLLSLLRPGQLSRAICSDVPNELLLQVQAEGGRFDGLPGRDLDEPQRAALCELIATALTAYDATRASAAMDDIGFNGGFENLHIAAYREYGFYADGSRFVDAGERAAERPYFQVWRIEGPGMILHFQGWPHVHAYLRVTRNPLKQHVGEELGIATRLVEAEGVRSFMDAALKRTADADAGFIPGPLPGRFVPGPVTTGTLTTFDPFANKVVVAKVRGDRLGASQKDRIGNVDPGRMYRIATIDYALAEYAADLGEVEAVEALSTGLRDVLIDHARAGGLRSLAG